MTKFKPTSANSGPVTINGVILRDLKPGQIIDQVWCVKCNRPVEHFQRETPVEEVPQRDWTKRYVHTGEVIVEIRCHGERWCASNWRGEF